MEDAESITANLVLQRHLGCNMVFMQQLDRDYNFYIYIYKIFSTNFNLVTPADAIVFSISTQRMRFVQSVT